MSIVRPVAVVLLLVSRSIYILNCSDFSCESAISEEHVQWKKRELTTEAKCSAKQEKSEVFQMALDVKFTETKCTSDFALADPPCSITVCKCKASDVSSNLLAFDKIRELGSSGKELSCRRKTSDLAMLSSDDVPLCSRCKAIEQQRLVRSVRPRSLEVTKDISVNRQDHQYENIEHIFRVVPRATSGNCLNVDKGGNKEDYEDVESQASSSVTATTPVGRITSSASVDTAIGHSTRMCKCSDIDLVSYLLMYNSVELQSTTENPVGISERGFQKNKGAEMMHNQAAHCSRRPGEISLLNKDLLKHCSHNKRSVSMPINIVPARQLTADQRIDNSLASDVNTVTAGQSQQLQPTHSGSSTSPAAEMKAMRKRAYRVGLNLFNR